MASNAPYIIICNGRIDVAAAKNTIQLIQAASHTATDLVKYYGDKLTDVDTKPISTLQHEMMDSVQATAHAQTRDPSEMVDEMFALLDALEDKMGS